MKRKPLLAIVVASVLAMALNAQVVETVTTNGLSEPYGVAVPASTNVYYYTSSATGDVLEFDPVTKEITLLMDGLNVPQGIVSARGGLVVSESGGHRIAFISLAGGYSVLAGGTQGSRDGAGTAAQFNNPSGLAADAAGNIYIADLKNNSIRKLALDNTVTTVATGFFEPAGVAVDETGRLFVADTRSHVIRMVNLDGSKVIISGVEREPGPFLPHLDGPRGVLWVGGQTGLLVSDSGNHVIRQVSPRPAGWATSVFAGKSGSPGYVEGAPLTVARFNSPLGLAVDQTGGILVADLVNDALRRVGRIALPPVSILPASGTYSNSITVTITNPVPNAVFRYTTDGTDPTLNAPVAGRNLTLTKGPLPLKVRAFSPDYGASEVASNNYVFAVGPLLLSTPGGSFENPEPLLIFSFTDDVVIHFTVDGSLPTTNDPVWQDSLWPITGPLQAQGYRDGFTPSAVVSNYFTFTAAQPVILPPGASTNNNVEVSLSTTTTGATIRWTIDGSEPSRLSALYDKPFILGTNGTLKAKAFRTGFKDSLVSTQVFNLTVGTPAVLPSGGTNNTPVSVEFFTATQGADFYWTINGTEPTPQNGAKYSGPFQLATNGVLQVRGYKSGYLPSAIASNAFTMIVGNPVISPAGATTNDVTRITLSTVTPGAQLIWTVDGTEPARGHGTIYTGPFDLGTNGVLQVRGVRDGFLDSAVVSNAFNLTVSNPVISPAGATTNDSVRVTLTSETPGAQLIWTIDGTEPGRGRGTIYTGPFDLGTNGILQVRGVRAGFADSGVSSNLFNLSVGDPVVTPGAGGFVNSVTVAVATTTPGPVLRYTVDGTVPTISSPTYTGPLVFTTNTILAIGGFRSGFIPSLIVSNEYRLKVDAPRITLPDGSEASGFIPNGIQVKVTVARAGARIHYTLDGTVPTTNSPAVGPDGLVAINQLTAPGRDLEALRVRAFATGVDPSDVVDGQPIAANTAGVPRNMAAGIGSTIVVPVVINLQSNTVLKTMQMKLEVSPVGTAPNLEFDLRALPSNASDFVQVLSPGEGDSFSLISVGTYRDVSSAGVATNGMIITALGTNANLTITHYGMVALVVVPIPRTAKTGDRYNIALLNPSGTVDGQQTVLPLGSLPARTIEITNIAYRVGDTSPGRWYNAGDFGDGSVDNSDVNNAFYASLGARIPYNFTDAFDAMDVYPADEDGAAGGDGEIRFLDWQLILQRSLNRDTNIWYRSWAPGGVRQASRAGGGVTPLPRATSATKPAGHVWQRQVLLRSGVVENARPGQLVSLPVYALVARGKSIAGLQFRARIESEGEGLRVPVAFVPAAGLPQPLSLADGAPNQVTAAWSLQANPFVPALTGSNYLGEVRFVVPETARPGQCYTLRFRNADGAPDLATQYDFETQPGAVWAQTAASTPASTTSDEWKARFFADVTSADAADDADPDHDGVPNWQEYQAGTSPVSLDSRLAFFSTEWDAARGGLVFRWLSAPGKFYTLEVSSGLGNGPWEAIATDIPGDGGIVEHVETKLIRATGFYRLRVQP